MQRTAVQGSPRGVAAVTGTWVPGAPRHSYFVVSLDAGLFVSPEPGPVLANDGRENLRFTNQNDETVAAYDVLTLVAKHWPM